MTDVDSAILGVILVLGIAAAIIAGYILPSIIGVRRGVNGCCVLIILNLLLGWTFIMWLVCLIWAVTAKTEAEDEYFRRAVKP